MISVMVLFIVVLIMWLIIVLFGLIFLNESRIIMVLVSVVIVVL